MPKLNREKVYKMIDVERGYQDEKWPQNPPLSPSDEVRLIRKLILDADNDWYTTHDKIINGERVNEVDLVAIRKIAGICVRCIENHGAPERSLF